jgi:hypothetical protein
MWDYGVCGVCPNNAFQNIQETIRIQLYVMQTLFENTLKLTEPEPGREHIYIYFINLVLTSFGTHLNNFDTS